MNAFWFWFNFLLATNLLFVLLSIISAIYGFAAKKNGFVQLAVVFLILPLMDLLRMFIPNAPAPLYWLMGLALFMAVMRLIRSRVE